MILYDVVKSQKFENYDPDETRYLHTSREEAMEHLLQLKNTKLNEGYTECPSDCDSLVILEKTDVCFKTVVKIYIQERIIWGL